MCTEKNWLVKCDRTQCTNNLKISVSVILTGVHLPHIFLGSPRVYSRQHATDDWWIKAIMVNVFNRLMLALIAWSLAINCPTLHLNSRHNSHQPLRGHARKYQSNSSDFIRESLVGECDRKSNSRSKVPKPADIADIFTRELCLIGCVLNIAVSRQIDMLRHYSKAMCSELKYM